MCSVSRAIAGAAALTLLILGGCKGQEQLGSAGGAGEPLLPPSALREFVLRSEAAFHPGSYEDAAFSFPAGVGNLAASTVRTVAVMAAPETTAGFRVQVLFTQDIDQANKLRETLDSLLATEWVYIVYDAPYYKVRAGDFDDRVSAAPLLRQLSSSGFKDAWIVPDHIVTNFPPKPPAADIEAVPRLVEGDR